MLRKGASAAYEIHIPNMAYRSTHYPAGPMWSAVTHRVIINPHTKSCLEYSAIRNKPAHQYQQKYKYPTDATVRLLYSAPVNHLRNFKHMDQSPICAMCGQDIALLEKYPNSQCALCMLYTDQISQKWKKQIRSTCRATTGSSIPNVDALPASWDAVPAMPLAKPGYKNHVRHRAKSTFPDWLPPEFRMSAVARAVRGNERKLPAAQKAIDAEWDRLRKIKVPSTGKSGTWDESAVREWRDVQMEARRKNTKIHILRLCTFMSSERI